MKILKTNPLRLIFGLCILVLAWPFGAISGNPQTVPRVSKAPPAAVSVYLPEVRVIQPVVSSEVAVKDLFAKSLGAAECQITFADSANLIQGGSPVNLNQPAGCFSLQIAGRAKALSIAFVGLLARENFGQVRVVLPGAKIALAGLKFPGWPMSPNLPVLPLQLLLAAGLACGFKRLRNLRVVFARVLRTSVNFYALQVMRC